MTPAPVPYAGNAVRHAADSVREGRRSTLIARLRLATFLAAATLLVLTLSRGATPLPLVVALVLFVAFGILVAWHARVDERVARHDALRLVNVRALARRARDWHALPDGDAPAGIDLTDHPYALDLDLFGRASLFQWLGPAATPHGRTLLATWLLQPAARGEVARTPGCDRRARHPGRLALAARGARGPRRWRQAARDRPFSCLGRRPGCLWPQRPTTSRHGAHHLCGDVGAHRGACHGRHPDCPLADSARGRTRPVLCHRRARAEDIRSRRRRAGCARPLRRHLRARRHRPVRRRAVEGTPGASVGGWASGAGVHAPAQSHPWIRRVAARGGDSPLSLAGVYALGFPRALRARTLAEDERAAASGAGSPRSASSTRSRSSRPCAGITRSGPFQRSATFER